MHSYFFFKGDKKGNACGNLVKDDGNLCKSHITKVKFGVMCDALLKTGTREGKECGVRVTDKSFSDHLCTRHSKVSVNNKVKLKNESKKILIPVICSAMTKSNGKCVTRVTDKSPSDILCTKHANLQIKAAEKEKELKNPIGEDKSQETPSPIQSSIQLPSTSQSTSPIRSPFLVPIHSDEEESAKEQRLVVRMAQE